MTRILVGIGNPGRADDAVGIVIAERLKDYFDSVLSVQSLMPEDLLSIRGFDELVIVDGATNIPEGDVREFSINNFPGCRSASHFMELGDLIELGKKLYQDFPPKISLIGIGIKNIGFEDGLSPHIEKRLDQICGKILEFLA